MRRISAGEVRVKPIAILCSVLIATAAVTGPAHAGELFGGLYVHDVDTPLSKSGIEQGMDVMLGYRGGKIAGTRLQPYIFGAINNAGETNYAAVGLSARFGSRLYVRPGLGFAVHTGSAKHFQDLSNGQIDFGSRVLLEPELAIGARLSDRLTFEASWIHMSHAQLFGRQNPGIDNFGVRLNLAL